MTLTIRPGITLKPGVTLAKPLPPVSYSLSSDGNSVDEASSKTIDVTTTAVSDGTTLWWSTEIQGTNMSLGRLSPGSGSLTITGGAASFSITVSADDLTSPDQQAFFVHLFKGAQNGQPGSVGVGDLTIYVGDTSQTPPAHGSAVFTAASSTSLQIGQTYWTLTSNAGLNGAPAGTTVYLKNPSGDVFTTTLHNIAYGGTFNINKVNNVVPTTAWHWDIGGNPTYDITSVTEPTMPDTPWNLGTTWTIEFWIKANGASSTQQGLVCQDGWFGNLYGGNRDNAILVALVDGTLAVGQTNGYDANYYTEPPSGVWTHVAIVNNGGAQTVFYNGIEQVRASGNYGSASYTNNYMPLYIGKLGGGYDGFFDGKLTNLRITDRVEYAADFYPPATLPTKITDHTRLLWTPTDQALATDTSDTPHTITNNNGTAYSSDYVS